MDGRENQWKPKYVSSVTMTHRNPHTKFVAHWKRTFIVKYVFVIGQINLPLLVVYSWYHLNRYYDLIMSWPSTLSGLSINNMKILPCRNDAREASSICMSSNIVCSLAIEKCYTYNSVKRRVKEYSVSIGSFFTRNNSFYVI